MDSSSLLKRLLPVCDVHGSCSPFTCCIASLCMSGFNGAVINAFLPSPWKMREQSLNIHAPEEGIFGKVQ